MLKDLVERNRSYRRFYQDQPINESTLRRLVDLARQTPSARNAQPLKYFLSCDPEQNAIIFEHLAWAGYLKNWGGPVEGERPAAYILILADTEICSSVGCDHGIAAQTILLGAVELELGGCMVGSVRRPELAEKLRIPPRYEILLAIALGKPKESVQLDPLSPGGDIRYWRDEEQVHHVPKRSLDEIILHFE